MPKPVSFVMAETLERRFSRRLLRRFLEPGAWGQRGPGLEQRAGGNNLRIVIVGGGISGSALARQLLLMCAAEGRDIQVTLLNSTNCNYCGGLVTDLASHILEKRYRLDVPRGLALAQVEECIFANQSGACTVHVGVPLISILRTSKFGVQGFDDLFRSRISEDIDRGNAQFTVIEPAVVTGIVPGDPLAGRPGTVAYRQYGADGAGGRQELPADVVVVASGLRSLRSRTIREFMAATGYRPPETMEASVTELDISTATHNLLENRVAILDGILPQCVVALIPKRRDWLTVTSLQRALTPHDVEAVFASPVVKEFIDLPRPSSRLRCRKICSAAVFISPARNFYGDGWVVLGDLAGCGRVFKDGYFAAFLGAHLVADTILHHGISRRHFAAHYHKPMTVYERDNRIGLALFRVNNWLNRYGGFRKLLLAAAKSETLCPYTGRGPSSRGGQAIDTTGGSGANGSSGGTGPVSAAIRALTTGELSYGLIALLLFAGLMLQGLRDLVRGIGGGVCRTDGGGRSGRAG